MEAVTRVEYLRKQYPVGTVVELLSMEDSQAPPVGTRGIVCGVDDIGTIHINWQTHSSLGVVDGVDRVRIVEVK